MWIGLFGNSRKDYALNPWVWNRVTWSFELAQYVDNAFQENGVFQLFAKWDWRSEDARHRSDDLFRSTKYFSAAPVLIGFQLWVSLTDLGLVWIFKVFLSKTPLITFITKIFIYLSIVSCEPSRKRSLLFSAVLASCITWNWDQWDLIGKQSFVSLSLGCHPRAQSRIGNLKAGGLFSFA